MSDAFQVTCYHLLPHLNVLCIRIIVALNKVALEKEKYFYTNIYIVIGIMDSDDQFQNCLQLFALEMVSTFSRFTAI